MLKIRLTRGGAKKRPYYSIVVADSHSPRDGRFIEKVGSYNPLLKKEDPKRVILKAESITGWIAKGAQPTERVARFLAKEGLSQWEHGTNPKKGEPHAKAKERAGARAEREAALAAAAEEAKAAPPAPEPEPVAEEPAAEPEAVAEAEEIAAEAGEDTVAAEAEAAPVDAVAEEPAADAGEPAAEAGAEAAEDAAGEAPSEG